MVIGMVTGEEHMTKGILAYTPFRKKLGSRYTYCIRENVCLL